MKKTFFIIFLISLSISCKKQDEFDKNLKKTISTYIEEFPIMPKHKWSACYPSYNVNFDLYENDTVMAIVLLPGIGNFLKMQIESQNVSVSTYSKQDGYLLFDDQSPVVFFNTKLYSKKLYEKLNKEIPDTITTEFFDKMNPYIHADPSFKSEKLKLYIIRNNNFILINENDTLFKRLISNYDVVNNHYFNTIN